MKIGILTYHCVPNFGAQLQATSTVGWLKKMGHEPVVLHWYPKDIEDMYSRRIPQEQVACHDAYTKEYLPVTNICRKEDELICEINRHDLDSIIVGSDALFKYIPQKNRKHFSKRRLKYISKNVLSVEKLEGNPFFGGFASKLSKKIPIVAFSVSSQNCAYMDMSNMEKLQMKHALSNFSCITVRDEWTKGMVETVMERTGIQVTPDPVFSFNQNCFFQLPSKEDILRKYRLQEQYVLISFSTWYASGSYIKNIADEVWKAGYMPVAFPMPEKLFSAEISHQVNLPLNPIDWYALIKYSSGYIGERMHPIVVCLHNAVPFFCFDEYGVRKTILCGLRKRYLQESSKTFHILSKAGLTGWMYSYHQKEQLPSANNVVGRFLHFDREKCVAFSSQYRDFYEKSLNQLFGSFIK